MLGGHVLIYINNTVLRLQKRYYKINIRLQHKAEQLLNIKGVKQKILYFTKCYRIFPREVTGSELEVSHAHPSMPLVRFNV
ncbi:hypothetical protein FKM82_019482 [Ascaphus truei]